MDLSNVASALASFTRRKILMVLADQPMNVQEVLETLNQLGFRIKYRESVYRALEKLVDAELVEKFYDKRKRICYQLPKRKIEINLAEGTAKWIGT